MMNSKTRTLVLLLLGLGLTTVRAQQAIPATGGDASGSGGSVNYTIGQVNYSTNSSTGGTVTQGVQQPYEIYVVGKEDANGINLSVAAYPNPATDYLTLKADISIIPDLSYSLYDINGKLIESKKVVSNETSIEMKQLTPACYFLKVTKGEKELKTFKIIKK